MFSSFFMIFFTLVKHLGAADFLDFDEMTIVPSNSADFIKAGEILEIINGKVVWNTLLNMARSDFDKSSGDYYDPDVLLRVLLIAAKSEVDCEKFIRVNGLSFVFAATSFAEVERRAFAYAILTEFNRKLKARLKTNENRHLFSEAALIYFLVTQFRHSVVDTLERINNVVSHFFARVAKLMLVPSDPVYAPVMAFLALKPVISTQNVPEFAKLFFSSATTHFADERAWILRLCAQSVINSNDYRVLTDAHVLDACQMLFYSTISDNRTKSEALRLFHACAQIETVAIDMFIRMNFTSWIVSAVKHSYTTYMERVSLSDIFLLIAHHLRCFFGTSVEAMDEDRARRRKRAKMELNSNVELIFHNTLKINAQMLIECLQKTHAISEKMRVERVTALKEITAMKSNFAIRMDSNTGRAISQTHRHVQQLLTCNVNLMYNHYLTTQSQSRKL